MSTNFGVLILKNVNHFYLAPEYNGCSSYSHALQMYLENIQIPLQLTYHHRHFCDWNGVLY